MPSPLIDARMVFPERNEAGGVYELMSDPPYELAIAQVAVAYALDCETDGTASAALDIARKYWQPLCFSEREVELSDEHSQLVNAITPYSADQGSSELSRTKWRPSELIAIADNAFAMPYPTDRETKAAKKGIGELLGRCLRHWLMNLGVPKGAAIGYLLTLEAEMRFNTAIPLPTKRRFNDLPDLDNDPRRVIRNLIDVWQFAGIPRPSQLDIDQFCEGFEANFEEKKDPRK